MAKEFIKIDIPNVETVPKNFFRNLEIEVDKATKEDVENIANIYIKQMRQMVKAKNLRWRNNLISSIRRKNISDHEIDIMMSEHGFMLDEMRSHWLFLPNLAHAPIQEWVDDREPLRRARAGADGESRPTDRFVKDFVWVRPHKFIKTGIVRAFGRSRSYLTRSSKIRKKLRGR